MKVSWPRGSPPGCRAHQRGTQGAVQAHGQRAAWRTPCQKAVTVCPLRRPEASVTVPLMMMGRRPPVFQRTFIDGKTAAFRHSRCQRWSRPGSSTSAPPQSPVPRLLAGRQRRARSDVARAGVVHVGADVGRLGRGGRGRRRRSAACLASNLSQARANFAPPGHLRPDRPWRSPPGPRWWRRRCCLDQVGTSGQVCSWMSRITSGRVRLSNRCCPSHRGKVLNWLACSNWPAGVALPPAWPHPASEALTMVPMAPSRG